MFLSYAFGVIVLIFVLLGQGRIAVVRRVFRPRLPVFLGVIGLFETIAYAGDHHVTSSAWAWVLASWAVGAIGVGALRGLSMRVWSSNSWVVRQGTTTTMALWLLTLFLQFVGNAGGGSGSSDIAGASFLLYLGLTIGLQNYVVFRRGQPLWNALGPDAGRPLQFHFSQGPGTFFATFRSDGGMPPGWDAQGPQGPYDDPNIIDAEVVEDDDEHEPPELPAAR